MAVAERLSYPSVVISAWIFSDSILGLHVAAAVAEASDRSVALDETFMTTNWYVHVGREAEEERREELVVHRSVTGGSTRSINTITMIHCHFPILIPATGIFLFPLSLDA
jgi:hypothetical protein